MKYNLSSLDDPKKAKLLNTLWQSSSSLWEIVLKQYEKNKKIWKNKQDWVDEVPKKRSKARDNRTFLAVESVITTLTGRPSKPNTIPSNRSDEARKIADDLQMVFLEKYRELQIKQKMRKGLRNLFLARLIVLKIFWDTEKNDFDVRVVDPRHIRLSKHATSMYDTKFAIEEIPDISLTEFVSRFPDKEEEILKSAGYTKEQMLTDNPSVSYKEGWIGEDFICVFKENVLFHGKHPYWDFDGVPVTAQENVSIKSMEGANKRSFLVQASSRKREEDIEYESYLYNHFDKPIPPYIFGTVLALEDKPVGDTDLIDQVEPLQDEIDKRKRQISDNAQMMNGQWVIDTKYVNITKAEAQMAKNDPNGMWFGDGVSKGIDIKTGKEIPSFIANDMNHSIIELDNIFGTQPTFRGDGSNSETATGRAILREQSINRLDELVDLVDSLHVQLYNWMFQMMKVKYTEKHLVKPIGADKAQEVIELTRNDLQDGIEIQVIPGQIIQEDRLFKLERAKEEATKGLIDPLTYFEETGRDNPMQLAKRLIKYKVNPLSIIKLDDQDMQDLQNGQQQSNTIQNDQKSQQIEQLKQEAIALSQSPEFQQASPDNQERMISEIENKIKSLTQQ